jgi:hypothetical protein
MLTVLQSSCPVGAPPTVNTGTDRATCTPSGRSGDRQAEPAPRERAGGVRPGCRGSACRFRWLQDQLVDEVVDGHRPGSLGRTRDGCRVQGSARAFEDVAEQAECIQCRRMTSPTSGARTLSTTPGGPGTAGDRSTRNGTDVRSRRFVPGIVPRGTGACRYVRRDAGPACSISARVVRSSVDWQTAVP